MNFKQLSAVSITLLLGACGSGGGGNKDKAPKPEGLGGNGSCTRPEFCSEQAETSPDFGATCSVTGGTWSAKACDKSKYATSCEQESTEIVEGEAPQKIHTTYFYPADSKLSCTGKQTDLDKSDDQKEKVAPAAQAPATPADEEIAPASEETPSDLPVPENEAPVSTEEGEDLQPSASANSLGSNLNQTLAELSQIYCSVILANDVSDDYGQLKKGTTYLVGKTGFWPEAYVEDEEGQLQAVEFTREDVASSTCDTTASGLRSQQAFLQAADLYSTADLAGAPACRVEAGYRISGNYELAWSGDVTTVKFDALASLCGGITVAYAPNVDTISLYPISGQN